MTTAKDIKADIVNMLSQIDDLEQLILLREIASMAVRLSRISSNNKLLYKQAEREDTISKIKLYLSNKPVEKAWVFGSFARIEQRNDSDLDLLVRFQANKNIDLFDYAGIKMDLEDLIGRKVDLVEEGQELESLKANIERDKQLIYER